MSQVKLNACSSSQRGRPRRASAGAGGERFKTLKENIFVCVSPEAYDEAMVRVRELNGRDIEPLKKELARRSNVCSSILKWPTASWRLTHWC